MRVTSWIAAVAAVLLVGACTAEQQADVRDYCDRNPAICILAGAAVIGGIVGIVAATDHSSPALGHLPPPSDRRLKADIRPVGTLDNGLKLYAFHYIGDSQVFVSVMAQDLLADPQFRHAVSIDANGYYRADLAALHVEVIDGTAMLAAGERAELLAGPAH